MPELDPRFEEVRGIPKETCEFYGITTDYQPQAGGLPLQHTYPYPDGKFKWRTLPKGFKTNGPLNSLFGMDKFNGSSSGWVTVTEGELDAASAYYMLGSKSPVVSLPPSAISRALLKGIHPYLDSFKQIIVATDNDEQGDKAAKRLAATFPGKVYRVNMTTHKDANEYLQAGDGSDFKFAWINRRKYVPDFDTSTTEQYIEILRSGKDAEYLPTGIEAFDENHLGLMQGHMTVFTAKEGVGKTELFRYLEYNLIKNHPEVAFAYCHFEETQLRGLLGLVSYDLGKNVTRKELIDDAEEVEASIASMTGRDNVHMFSFGVDEEPTDLIERIRYYATVCDCKYVFIEPLQDLAYQRTGPETAEQFLTKLSVLLSRTAAEIGIGIVCIAHENDDGAIRDCRMIGKQSSVTIRLERDLHDPDPVTRNTTTMSSLKNRPSSFVGFAGQFEFDIDSFTIKEKTYE